MVREGVTISFLSPVSSPPFWIPTFLLTQSSAKELKYSRSYLTNTKEPFNYFHIIFTTVHEVEGRRPWQVWTGSPTSKQVDFSSKVSHFPFIGCLRGQSYSALSFLTCCRRSLQTTGLPLSKSNIAGVRSASDSDALEFPKLIFLWFSFSLSFSLAVLWGLLVPRTGIEPAPCGTRSADSEPLDH